MSDSATKARRLGPVLPCQLTYEHTLISSHLYQKPNSDSHEFLGTSDSDPRVKYSQGRREPEETVESKRVMRARRAIH
ncbi:hypothetical protein CC1G_15723 [Coprinopsis cinerea okayama7|uniref:Uncharacterized protein n=1 Tax=Coprinopsis cinerea (strain Okayama-7 / 130 / ATCC MYA-4618 / FGSC 9003) TaxID=240176 RepID=D6RQI4_COPC7|nr:hypothetical protein CC1G_15723 [Coprinopsis cinerea okayama7\|eukprot:XP_002910294.1 hypothetical protein CC1G_15723 [Coprinopsis cinerea okayama7\